MSEFFFLFSLKRKKKDESFKQKYQDEKCQNSNKKESQLTLFSILCSQPASGCKIG